MTSPLIQDVFIAGFFPGMNEIIAAARGNRYASAKQKKGWTDRVAWTRKQKRLQPMGRVRLSIVYYEPNKRRDPDNIAAAKKFLGDGLVAAGVLAGDGHKYIAGFDESFEFGARVGIHVTLMEVVNDTTGNERA